MTNESRMEELKTRLASIMSRIEGMNPEETSVEDVDQLIAMLEDLEKKF
ncbi:SE1561 family protein [Pontibacillus halophilus]|nr:SE1561 family protein [Pontibacillus halophilus]